MTNHHGSEHDAPQREAARQQQLLRALFRLDDDPAIDGWCSEPPQRLAQALAAYRGNAAAIAGRALAAAYPTVQQLLGDESFDALARALWHRHPPQSGDLAHFGAELAGFVAHDAQLASEPYLADAARLDWAVHTIQQAADVPAQPAGITRLASDDPVTLRLALRPGVALIRSAWPIVSIWRAHRADDATADRFDAVRRAFEAGRRETAFVWRDGWRAAVAALDEARSDFTEAVLAGHDIAGALERAGATFSFEDWLRDALAGQWLLAVVDAAASHDRHPQPSGDST